MRLRNFLMLILTAALATQSLLADDVAITVYNDNLALVKEGRLLEFQKGINRLQLTDVAAFIDPTSVHFKMRKDERVDLLEQNFQYDLVSADKVLQKYLGNNIDVLLKNGDVVSGRFLSSSAGFLVLQLADGAVRMINSLEMQSVTAPKLPEGLIVVPTLQWLISSEISGKREAEISYLTSNISWHAEYIARLDKDDKNLRLSAWVSLDNQSGKTYKDAKLKLVAGEINRVQEPVPMMRGGRAKDMMLAEMAAPGFEEKSFFEYHLYTLGRPTTIANNETKQVSLFDPAETAIEKVYRYQAQPGSNDVNVVVKFKNSEGGGLGMPLPAGKVRVTKADTDGSEEFLGEDRIEHTPRNEEIELRVGNAFDIVGETNVIDSKRISDRVRDETIEVKLRNRKPEATTIVVQYNLWGDWQILDATHPHEKKTARRAEFKIPAPADQETILRFRVRYNG